MKEEVTGRKKRELSSSGGNTPGQTANEREGSNLDWLQIKLKAE